LLAGALAGLADKPKVLLSGSAIGFYGDGGDAELTEAADPGSGFLVDLVTEWEAAAAPADDAGIRTAFLRTGLVLSSEGGALAEQLPFFKLGLGGRIGSGQQFLSWITLDDQIGAILHLLEHDVSGPVNLTAPHPVRNIEFTKALGAALRRPTLIPIPRLALDLRLGKQAVDEMLMASQRIIPEVLLSTGYEFEHETIDAAMEALL
ncbi:MAG: TIGR01777 family oxidoreductase, partial [Acidimicrobiales bacterium]